MPVRASLRPLLAVANALDRLDRTPLGSVAERRAASARDPLQMANVTARVRQPLETTDFRIPVSGGEISVRRYRPVGRGGAGAVGSGQDPRPWPVHVFMHGGSFWLGSVAEYEPLCRLYAARVGCTVISVEYRLAPEHPYPNGVEDCYAAVCWVAASADMLGVDASRLTVGGVSAGGTMAAAVCLMARDRSGPQILAQILEIPATDLTMSCGSCRGGPGRPSAPVKYSPSIEEFGTGYVLTKASLVEAYGFYLSDPALAREAYASPLLAADLSRLPPAFVLTCECDPLRDEGEAYAARLADAGVPVTSRRVAGHVHGSIYLSRFLPSARQATESACAALSDAYAIARS